MAEGGLWRHSRYVPTHYLTGLDSGKRSDPNGGRDIGTLFLIGPWALIQDFPG